MTNFDYYKKTLTERELAELFCGSTSFRYEGRLHDAWYKWLGNTDGNIQKDGKIPNIWFWTVTFNEKANKWEKTGRNPIISIQQFLSMPYKKEYWN